MGERKLEPRIHLKWGQTHIVYQCTYIDIWNIHIRLYMFKRGGPHFTLS